jgi:putative transposase
MLKDGHIVPSKSPWSSPIVPIDKNNGSIRLCVDYRKLNDITQSDGYPIPDEHKVFYKASAKSVFLMLFWFHVL